MLRGLLEGFSKSILISSQATSSTIKVVSQLIEYRSKKLRNQIAGYITHLVNMAAKRKKAEEASARI